MEFLELQKKGYTIQEKTKEIVEYGLIDFADLAKGKKLEYIQSSEMEFDYGNSVTSYILANEYNMTILEEDYLEELIEVIKSL